MYQSIGINLSKNLDAATKKIKVPAITQRAYYKDLDNCEEEFINFYKSDSDYNNYQPTPAEGEEATRIMQKIQKRSSWIKDGTVSDSETATESDEEYDENSDAFTDSDDTEDPEA